MILSRLCFFIYILPSEHNRESTISSDLSSPTLSKDLDKLLFIWCNGPLVLRHGPNYKKERCPNRTRIYIHLSLIPQTFIHIHVVDNSKVVMPSCDLEIMHSKSCGTNYKPQFSVVTNCRGHLAFTQFGSHESARRVKLQTCKFATLSRHQILSDITGYFYPVLKDFLVTELL